MKNYTTVNIEKDLYILLKNRAARKNKPINVELRELILMAEDVEVNEKVKLKKAITKNLEPLRSKFVGIKASDLLDLDEYMYD